MTDRSVIDRLTEEWRTIAELCGDFAAPQWDSPTDCPEWAVRDIVAHLTGAEARLLGRPAPEPVSDRPAHVHNDLGAANEAWVREYRKHPPAKLLADFIGFADERASALRAATDEELAAPTPSPIGEVPRQVMLGIRLMDCWVHEQDIRRAVGRPGGLSGPVAEAVVDFLLRAFRRGIASRIAPAEGSVVALRITGPVARTLAVRFAGGRAETVDVPADSTVLLSMDTETFCCRVAGRWAADRVRDEGRVGIVGDQELGAAVLAGMAVIP